VMRSHARIATAGSGVFERLGIERNLPTVGLS